MNVMSGAEAELGPQMDEALRAAGCEPVAKCEITEPAGHRAMIVAQAAGGDLDDRGASVPIRM